MQQNKAHMHTIVNVLDNVCSEMKDRTFHAYKPTVDFTNAKIDLHEKDFDHLN